ARRLRDRDRALQHLQPAVGRGDLAVVVRSRRNRGRRGRDDLRGGWTDLCRVPGRTDFGQERLARDRLHADLDLRLHPLGCVRRLGPAPASFDFHRRGRALALRVDRPRDRPQDPRRALARADAARRRRGARADRREPAPARGVRGMKSAATPATLLLAEKGVEYTEHFYEYVEHGGTAVSSGALAVPEHHVVKTLVMETDKGDPLVVLMHGDR